MTAHGRGAEARLLGIEIIYAQPGRALVTRLAAAGAGDTAFDSGAARSLARLTGTPIDTAHELLEVGLTVCGQEVRAHVSEASAAGFQQARFTAHGTHVSVASWNLPLEPDWYAALTLAPAENLADLKAYLHVAPLLILDVSNGLPGRFQPRGQ